jgi:hypothetical protein
MLCARRPGLLLATMRAIEGLGLDVQQAVASCFNGFSLDIFKAEVNVMSCYFVATREKITDERRDGLLVFAQCLLAAVQGRPSAPPPARRRDQVRPPAVCRAPWRGAVTPDGRTACSPSRQKKKRNDVAFVRSVPSPCPVYIGLDGSFCLPWWLCPAKTVAWLWFAAAERTVPFRSGHWSLDSSAPASLGTLVTCRSRDSNG